jgi:hypothetical protein
MSMRKGRIVVSVIGEFLLVFWGADGRLSGTEHSVLSAG